MNRLINTLISIFKLKHAHAFLLFLTGFLFTQFILVNFLYTQHPQGGWETSLGMFSTPSILVTLLSALILCLATLWTSISLSTPSSSS